MAEKEYIERGEVLAMLSDMQCAMFPFVFAEYIKHEISTADVVEVRRGKWEITKKVLTSSNPYIDDDYYIRVECSECGFRVQETRGGYWYAKPITTNYCPNCGAKMDGKGENDG